MITIKAESKLNKRTIMKGKSLNSNISSRLSSSTTEKQIDLYTHTFLFQWLISYFMVYIANRCWEKCISIKWKIQTIKRFHMCANKDKWRYTIKKLSWQGKIKFCYHSRGGNFQWLLSWHSTAICFKYKRSIHKWLLFYIACWPERVLYRLIY